MSHEQNLPVEVFLPLATPRGVPGYSQGGNFGLLRGEDGGDAAGSLPSTSLMLGVNVFNIERGMKAEGRAL